MNHLKKLAEENSDNFETYIQRMEKSLRVSTKGLIPEFARDCKRILDVGCGAGGLDHVLHYLYPDAEIIGVDINQAMIDTLKDDGEHLRFLHASLADLKGEYDGYFDCVIFSSVLHEFSSYDSDAAYQMEPLEEAIRDTYRLLAGNGKIIIRDGLFADDLKPVRLRFHHSEDAVWLERFCAEFKGFRMHHVPKAYEQNGEEYTLSLALAKEFLYTYTWGEASWNREIQEQFGILSRTEWIDLLEQNGFRITMCATAAEEYGRYLREKVELYEPDRMREYPYSEMTITLTAVK